MPEWITSALESARPYWPFITQVVVIWYLGQVFKKRVWTKKRAARSSFYGMMRSTLVIHPIMAGALWGACFPYMPSIEWISTQGGAINAGLLAGALTLIGHTVLEALAIERGWTSVLRVLRETVPEQESVPPP